MAVHQVGVNFAISSSITSISGAFQSRDHEYKCEVESIRNGTGTTVSRIYYDAHEEATFEYYATGTDGANNVTVTVATPGNFLTIADAGYAAIVGSTWIVEPGVKTVVTNNGALKVTLPITRWPGITS